MADTELEDGLYSIRLASATSKCMDVAGGTDKSGENVWVWDYFAGPGQIAYVSKRDSGYVIGFPMTGKVVDLHNGEAFDNANIWQWPFNDTAAQYWDIKYANDTVALNQAGVNRSYNAYFIESKVDSNYTIATDGNKTANGTNVIITNKGYGAVSSRWVFVPIEQLPEGTYRISPRLTGTAVLGTAGHSSADEASVVLEAEDEDSNWQVVKVEAYDDGSNGIRNVQTNKALDCSRSSGRLQPKDGDDAIWYTAHLWDNQRWLIKYNGETVKRNNVDEPVFVIMSKFGTQAWALDVNGTAATPKTNVRMMALNYSKASQKFLFIPAEAYSKDLSVPSNVTGYLDGSYSNSLGATSSGTVYPAWNGSGEEWKVRYRTRVRKVGQANGTRSAWSGWKSILDNSEANSGWGVVGQANADAVLGDGRWTSSVGVAFSIGATSNAQDLVQVEFQVKQLAHEYGLLSVDAHSGSASAVCTIAYRPTLSIGAINITPSGVSVAYSSNFSRGSNRVRIYVPDLFDATATGVNATGTLTSKTLRRVPENDEEVSVRWEITTADGVTNTGAVTKKLSVSMTNAQAMNVTQNWVADGLLLRLTAPAGSIGTRCWMTIDGKETIEVSPTTSAGRVFDVPYPFNKPFKILIAATISGAIRVWNGNFTAREVYMRMWNFTGGWCGGPYAKDEPPQETVTTSASSDDRPTTTGNWHRVTVGSVVGQSINITLAAAEFLEGDIRDRLLALAKSRYAWYRNSAGQVIRVAVVSVNETRMYWGIEYTVDMRRIDN